MEIQYVKPDTEMELAAECSVLSCALKLDLLAESICVTPIKVETDDPECTIFDTENRVIYWTIPEILLSDINRLLSLVAPLAESIIFHIKNDANYTEIPLDSTVEIVMTMINRYINDQLPLQASI